MDAAGTDSRERACRKENTVKNRRETIQQKIPGRFSALGDLVPVAGVEPARLLCRGILRLRPNPEEKRPTRKSMPKILVIARL